MTERAIIDPTRAELHALRQVKVFGYEWGVLPSGEVIPFYVMEDGHSPAPADGGLLRPNALTHPQWMDCYVVFEVWQVEEET